MMGAICRDGLFLLQLFYTVAVCAGEHGGISADVFSFAQSRPRFADVLLSTSKELSQEYVELSRGRAQLELPQLLIQKQIMLLDDDIRQICKQRDEIAKQLTLRDAEQLKKDSERDELIIKTESLSKEKRIIIKRREEYKKNLKESHDSKYEGVGYGIMIDADDKQLELCEKRIALLQEKTMELYQEMAPLMFEISSLKNEIEQLNISSEARHRDRATLMQEQEARFDAGIKLLLDQFDAQIELSIVIAYASPIDIFDRLISKTDNAQKCAWCLALLKVFRAESPSYQQIISFVQNKESDCGWQAYSDLCNYFSVKEKKLFSTIADRCLQQLKRDKVYRVCSGCSDSLIKKENLLKEGAFVGHVKEIVRDYIVFRLNYLELFQKQPVTIKKVSSGQHAFERDLLHRYSAHMKHLENVLDDKNNIRYLKMNVKTMNDVYDAYDCFVTKQKLSERVSRLLKLSQVKVNRALEDHFESSCQSLSSSSISSLSELD